MKKNAADKAEKQGRKPFFARLLEAQELEQASGGLVQTKKYPSDSDEAVTMKYPSDGDDDVCK
jgi:Serine endopeptidase inhibitors